MVDGAESEERYGAQELSLNVKLREVGKDVGG
jgi:hypothetical protein